MAEVETVPASPRESAGKGSARQARRDGLVPAVIYGNKEEPIKLTMERRTLSKELNNPQFYIQLVDIEIDGTKHRVLPRDVQFHPVSDAPMHVDFLRFDPNRKITAAVPVALSIAPLQISSSSPGAHRARWSQCAVWSTYSSGRSAPGRMPITFFEEKLRVSFANDVETVAPSGTGSNPFCFAAADRSARLCPVASRIRSATAFWTQPFITVWSAPPSSRWA